jgi:hypothetical protein
MTVVEKIARKLFVMFRSVPPQGDAWRDYENDARTVITALHDSFADPVVRAAIQAALDEKGG